jgi:hypothetical protein
MNSLAYNDSNNVDTTELEHKEVNVNKSVNTLNKSKQKHKHVIYNDVCTASYVLGYN